MAAAIDVARLLDDPEAAAAWGLSAGLAEPAGAARALAGIARAGVPFDLLGSLAERLTVLLPTVADPDRVLVAVDSATSHRLTDGDPCDLGTPIVNIDPHHDNPAWGDLNLIDGGASSTAELVVRVADALDVDIDESVALPLYVGLVTDTGRFSYSSTGPEAHVAAARFVEAGVDPGAVYRHLYEGTPLGDLKLMGRAVASARPELGGRLVVTVIDERDVR